MATVGTDLHYMTISQAAELLRRQELSPVELIQAFLQRIDATDGDLHSFLLVLKDQAMADARVAEAEILRGEYKGPLHGIPFALKDLYDTAGVRTLLTSYQAPDMYAFAERWIRSIKTECLSKMI